MENLSASDNCVINSTHIIYKTTNMINGKYYIGQHHQETSGFDGYFGSGNLLKRSVIKYGRENFIRETLEYCTSATVNDKEIYWIAQLSATDKEIGYNLSNGGETGRITYGEDNPNFGTRWTEEQRQRAREKRLGTTISEEQKIKISEWNRINGNPFKGKQHSDETKQHWSEIRKGKRTGEENSFYGKQHSQETKDKLRKIGKIKMVKYLYNFISPSGEQFKDITNLQDFCDRYGWNQHNIKFKDNLVVYRGWNQHNIKFKDNLVVYRGWKISKILVGKPESEETKLKRKIAQSNKTHSIETIEKIKKTKKLNDSNVKYIYTAVDPTGIIHTIKEFKIFCQENNMCYDKAMKSIHKNKFFKGWKITRKLFERTN